MLFNWCWRRLLRVPWNARRSNQSILKISPGISLEGTMLKLKLQYFGHLMWRVDLLEKTLMLGGIGGRRIRDDRGWNGWMRRLEKTLLVSKIKPVNPKGNQPWIFIGRMDAEAEAPILRPSDAKRWLIGKNSNTGKIEGRRERGQQMMRSSDGITNSLDMSLT